MNILMQVHVPDFDIQGNLNYNQKIDIVDFVIEYTKNKNKNAGIYISGHGHKPNTLSLCKGVYWEDKCRKLAPSGFVDKMPAQYVFVSRGLDLIDAYTDPLVLRTRGDSIINIPNVCKLCQEKLGDKEMIITQQTNNIPYKMGDFFQFAKLSLLRKIWSENNPIKSYDGLIHFGETAINVLSPKAEMPRQWHETLLKHCVFLDLFTLKFIDLRWNYHKITKKYGWNNFKNMAFNDEIDFREFLWGNFEQWSIQHRTMFDNDGNLIHVTDDPQCQFFSEKTFYNTK